MEPWGGKSLTVRVGNMDRMCPRTQLTKKNLSTGKFGLPDMKFANGWRPDGDMHTFLSGPVVGGSTAPEISGVFPKHSLSCCVLYPLPITKEICR